MTDAALPTGLLRILPTEVFLARRPQRLLERAVMVYRRSWVLVVSGFFEPLFYLLSIRVGFSALIGDVQFGGESIPYAQFVAPALMAASAMNGAVWESTMNVLGKFKQSRLYDSILSTPLTPADIALGEIGWAVIRGLLYSVAFVLCMWAMGLLLSPWAVLAVPFCVLIGVAFASLGMAATTFMRSWTDIEYVTTVTLPMFLFSATFYPLSSYGRWGWVVQLSPLYHGVALVRGATLGQLEWTMVIHVLVLAAIGAAGIAVASRRICTLLLK
jgi:lipooligosaccharide transport system permease protein